ncbi:MAG: dihydroorotate dehydrogenase electron transfer subunit [Actinomycetota bacterium]
MSIVRRTFEVLSNRRAGAYRVIQIVAPEIAEQARPGQFIEVGVGEGREFLLRRPFSIADVAQRGPLGGTLDIAVYGKGGGTSWLAELQAHESIDVIGPLGTPFGYPTELKNCLLVGGGYGAAPLYFLADQLRERGKRVDMVIGARTEARLYEPVEARRRSRSVVITTEDGSQGEPGRVTDVMKGVLAQHESEVVYACGPNDMLRAVADYCLVHGIPCQVAVEEFMACGLGVCWTCVVPVRQKEGRGWENLRTCVEGPVFNGALVWWDRWLGPEEPLVSEPEMETRSAGGES